LKINTELFVKINTELIVKLLSNYVKLTTGLEPTIFLLTKIRLILYYQILKNTILIYLDLL